MQQTSGSSFCRCGDDEGFVVVSFLSLLPSFPDWGGGKDDVVVVVDVVEL